MWELVLQDARRIVCRRTYAFGLLAVCAFQVYVLFSSVVPVGYAFDFATGSEVVGSQLPVPAAVVAALGNTSIFWMVLPGSCAAWLARELSSGYVDVRRTRGAARESQILAAFLSAGVSALLAFGASAAVLAAVFLAIRAPATSAAEAQQVMSALQVQGVVYQSPLDARYLRDALLPLTNALLAVAVALVLALATRDALLSAVIPAVCPLVSFVDIRPLAEVYAIGTRALELSDWLEAILPTLVGLLAVVCVATVLLVARRAVRGW